MGIISSIIDIYENLRKTNTEVKSSKDFTSNNSVNAQEDKSSNYNDFFDKIYNDNVKFDKDNSKDVRSKKSKKKFCEK